MEKTSAPAKIQEEAPFDPNRPERWTQLQGHVAFWDPDRDGIIWPSDMYLGLRALGFGIFLSWMGVLLFQPPLSWLTREGVFLDPLFRIRIAAIHKAEHGSESRVYTRRGMINEDSFDDLFRSYSSDPDCDGLTFMDTMVLWFNNCDPLDFFGAITNLIEWFATFLLIWPEDGKMKKQDIRGVYDGSYFWEVAQRQTARKKSKDSKD